MRTEAAFWDSSALVPLCVRESASRQAHSQLRKFAPVVWWGSQVEVYSAVARLWRAGELSEPEKKGAVNRLNLLARAWREILPEGQLREVANHLLDLHALRAAESLQLAAALTWCQHRPAKRSFVCADQRLANEAHRVGFTVVEL